MHSLPQQVRPAGQRGLEALLHLIFVGDGAAVAVGVHDVGGGTVGVADGVGVAVVTPHI
eukprot:CAMPEP_0184665648 /NCGR_PEP_ID=MMETSP0308-20130426/58088_1 /TAXON_ID=38269 /ORGANISM="Gloeochaete witrockiana, Strain SAG 46.84" /LENGTH=58 /DNA_ID=CAMNT_0027109779 /DNA_START=881 /DNA_END=1057 /DNA_ORIENTATION=-